MSDQALVPRAAAFIIDETDCSYRQLDRWARQDLFDDTVKNTGIGSIRQWNSRHAEIAWALTALSAMGAQYPTWRLAADAIAARPVLDSEWLIVGDDIATRHDHICFDGHARRAPVYVIPLRSFASSVVPATTDSEPSPADPSGEDGRRRSVPAPANHST